MAVVSPNVMQTLTIFHVYYLLETLSLGAQPDFVEWRNLDFHP